MGCRYESPPLRLAGDVFGGALAGLEVVMRESSLTEYARIAPLLDEVGPAFVVEPGVRPPSAPLRAMAELGEAIGPLILSWNLEDLEGNPRPVEDWPVVGFALQLMVASAWCAGMVAYADSLTPDEPVKETDLPMDPPDGEEAPG